MTDLYSTFALEAKFGFNKMTLKLYVADKLKGIDSRPGDRRSVSFRHTLADAGNRRLLVDLGICLYQRIPTLDDRDLSHVHRAVVQ